MTLPPKSTSPSPAWKLAYLVAPDKPEGLVEATCAGGGEGCSFDGVIYDKTPGQLRVGPATAGVPGREVMVWCKATNALTVGASPQQVLRVSFTNFEPREVPLGTGWWDVSPAQVTTGQGPVDTTPFAAC